MSQVNAIGKGPLQYEGPYEDDKVHISTRPSARRLKLTGLAPGAQENNIFVFISNTLLESLGYMRSGQWSQWKGVENPIVRYRNWTVHVSTKITLNDVKMTQALYIDPPVRKPTFQALSTSTSS